MRDWLHVDDHCRGIQLALERGEPGNVYHIGGGTELSNRSLTRELLAACGADWSAVRHVADRLGHDRRYSLDDSRLRALGYQPGPRSPRACAPPSTGTGAIRTGGPPVRSTTPVRER